MMKKIIAQLAEIENLKQFSHKNAPEISEQTRSCLETTDQVYTYRPDPTDQAIENPEEEQFTDDSSFIKDGVSATVWCHLGGSDEPWYTVLYVSVQ